MSDLIKRSDAIKAVNKAKAEGMVECPTYYIGLIPSADRPQDGEFKNFDREDLILLIECQKERIGELLADRPQGEWMRDDDYHRCSNCHCVAPLDGEEYWMRDKIREDLTEICPNCGARMFAKDINVPNKKGADDE